MLTTQSAQARDEIQLRQLIADQTNDICTKDLGRLMSHYAADVIVFDVKPPLQVRGADAYRRLWEVCFPFFPNSFQIEVRDFHLTVGDDLAFAHWLSRFAGVQLPHPMPWLRITAVYRKTLGKWQVVHEHVSVPFHPETGQAALGLEP